MLKSFFLFSNLVMKKMSKHFPRYKTFNNKPYQLKGESELKSLMKSKAFTMKKLGWKTQIVSSIIKSSVFRDYTKYALYARKD